MKNLFTLLLIAVSMAAFSQPNKNYFDQLGIGIKTPNAKLHVYGVAGNAYGFPVGVRMTQPDNGSYADLIENSTAPNLYAIRYMGNSGDFWQEVHDGFTGKSVEFEMNPVLNVAGLFTRTGGTILLQSRNGTINLAGKMNAGIGNNVGGFNSHGIGSNIQVAGTNNVGMGQNTVVESINGGTGTGADGHIYPSASYAFITNDANDTWGTASALFGFGNDNYVENGLVAGNDNVLGHLENDGLGTPNKYNSSFMLAQMSRAIGSRNLTVGRAVETRGDDIYAFATGLDGSRTRIVADHPGSFNIGFNNKWRFQVFKEGQIVINGVSYNFPTSQGAPGSVLTNDGNGNLSWSAPAATARARVTSETPAPGKYMVMTTTGQLLYLIQVK